MKFHFPDIVFEDGCKLSLLAFDKGQAIFQAHLAFTKICGLFDSFALWELLVMPRYVHGIELSGCIEAFVRNHPSSAGLVVLQLLGSKERVSFQTIDLAQVEQVQAR